MVIISPLSGSGWIGPLPNGHENGLFSMGGDPNHVSKSWDDPPILGGFGQIFFGGLFFVRKIFGNDSDKDDAGAGTILDTIWVTMIHTICPKNHGISKLVVWRSKRTLRKTGSNPSI